MTDKNKKGRSAKSKRHAAQRERARSRAAQEPDLDAHSLISTAPPASWPDHRRKLGWAQLHIQEIERLFEQWTSADSYEISMEPDGKGTTELVGTQTQNLPDALGLLIGDALQAMRSSLDNLAFALACKHSPGMKSDEERDISFPIYKGPAALGSKSIRLMSTPAQLDIIDLGPNPLAGPNEDHPLWLLNETNNRDKHRAITVAVTNLSDIRWNSPGRSAVRHGLV